ncbi:hypothetical protein HDU85_006543 [Gaertneriomyces sp. JEL0708]|nr:hypothetical protein HDU85_006543 [Gaertneriomyces sp. JEL0708]
MAGRTILDLLKDMPPLPLIRPLPERSSTRTTTPTYPRTDLRVLRAWNLFSDEITATRISLRAKYPTAPIDFPIRAPSRPYLVSSEAQVDNNYLVFILDPVMGVAASYFDEPVFTDIAGNKDVIGDPDFIYRSSPSAKAKIVGEVKTPWAFDIEDILDEWSKNGTDERSKIFRAISQLYGYMTFNCLRYGILTTYNSTWFFQRSFAPQGGVLEVSERFTPLRNNGRELIQALFTIVRLAEAEWFYVSPTHSPAPSPSLSRRAPTTIDPYELQKRFPYSDVKFVKGKARSRAGAIVAGLFRGTNAFMKTVDISKHDDLALELAHEVSVYQTLSALQGTILVNVLGYAEVWNMLRMLVLEPFGEPVSSVNVVEAKDGCLQALQALHQAGYCHGDIKLANFLFSNGEVRIIDFGFAAPLQAQEQAQNEMRQLRNLLPPSL